MDIKPVRRLTISDEIAEQIKELIFNGALNPGDRLPPELELAEKFGASRSSVREGLKALSYIGLIDRSKEGTFVSTEPFRSYTDPMILKLVLKRINLECLYEARKVIEIPLAGMAAERRTIEDLKDMEKCIEAMSTWVGNPELFGEEGLDFHLAVASASQNRVLYESIYAIKSLQMVSNREVVQSKEIFNSTLKYHAEIFEAIKSGNAEAAKDLMLMHILHVEKELEKLGML